jgi:hypothetical protein
MKNHSVNVFWLFAALLLMASCEVVDLTDLHSSNSSQGSTSANAQTLRVNATATEGTISYPVTVYAFDADGSYVASQAIESASGSLSLKLDPGSYRIVALAGTDDITIEEVEGLGSKINVPSQSTTALQMGSANVTITSTPVNAYINMGYMVSGVRFTLSNVPEDATAVSVTVSNVATQMDFSGTPAGNSTTVAPLSYSVSDKVWQSDEIYIVPAKEQKTIFSINITRPDNTETYAYTYPSALVVGTPYHFRGKYTKQEDQPGQEEQSGILLEGDFSAAVWDELQTIDFDFGGNDIGTAEGNEYIPSGSIWNGHVVAIAESIDEHNEELLLYSIAEWTDVSSSLPKSSYPNMADSIAKSYIEGDLSGWEIPTKAQVDAIKAIYYAGSGTSLSTLLEQVEGGSVGYWENSGNNTRYLCDGATYSYNFKQFNNVSKTGTSTLYRLRLVKKVKYTY